MFGRRFDYKLGGQGFILVRGNGFQGRAWHRTGVPDIPGRRSDSDAKFGELPDELDHPEVWDDWSGGAFHAYRRTGEPTYHWGENFDARFPRQLVHCQQVLNATTEQSFFIREVYTKKASPQLTDWGIPPLAGAVPEVIGAGYRKIRRYRADSGSSFVATTVADSALSMNFTYGGQGAVFNHFLYIGNLEATNYVQVSDAGGFWTVNPMPNPGTNLIAADDRLWSMSPTGFIKSTLDPTATANWTATLRVGDGYEQIHWAAHLDGQLFIGGDRGLFVGDSSGSFSNILGNSFRFSGEGIREVVANNGNVYFPLNQGIHAVYLGGLDAQVSEIGPMGVKDNRSPVHGTFRCLRPIADWLFTGLWTGSKSYLLAGIESGRGQYVWHTQQGLPSNAINRIHFDGITTASSGVRIPERCWVTCEPSMAASAPLLYFPIPEYHSNPLLVDPVFSANYIGSARIDLGNVDGGAPGTYKVYKSVEIWADNLLSGYRYCDIHYDVDQTGSFTLLGRAQTSPKSVLYFPSSEGSHIIGQSIELSMRSATLSPAITPVYRTVNLRSTHLSKSVDKITAVTRIADRMRDHQQGEMRSAAQQLTQLRGMIGTVALLEDVTGRSMYVQVHPPLTEQEFYQQGEDEPELMVTVQMSVLTLSSNQ